MLGYPGVLVDRGDRLDGGARPRDVERAGPRPPPRRARSSRSVIFTFRFRGLQGSEGADALYTTLLIAVAWGELGGSSSIAAMCVIFIAAQAALAYAGAAA